MPCYHPLPAWYARKRNESGKRGVVFRLQDGYIDMPVELPCGRCIGCVLERARIWAVRCSHEASMHDANSFLTLTYDDRHLPPGGSLRPRDFVLFMKRLRERVGKVRFFQCGEYGEKLGRPHHHCILFGYDFPDKVPLPRGTTDPLYTSALLSELWPHGFCSIGGVSIHSAGYVARYALKKVRGEAAAEHYGGRVPEYLTMSRRPGIGRGWIDKFHRDIYPSDELVVDGKVMKPPRYYDDRARLLNPTGVALVKRQREEAAKASVDNSGKRLIVREEVKLAQLRTLKRDMEGSNDPEDLFHLRREVSPALAAVLHASSRRGDQGVQGSGERPEDFDPPAP